MMIDMAAQGNKPPILEDIKPLELSPPTFIMVAEDKGDNTLRTKQQQQEEYDPEPQYEEHLKNMGATIISKKVEVVRSE